MEKRSPLETFLSHSWMILPLILLLGVFISLRYVSTAPSSDDSTIEVTTDPFMDLDNNPTKNLPPRIMLSGVPFTSQAPFGEWDDPIYKDGCEEASILMAAYWAKGQTSLPKATAKEEILKLSDRANEMYGTFKDSSAEDTLELYHEYFGLDGEVESNVTLDDIRAALAAGKLVGIPFDGREVINPNFAGDGPDRHFLVVIGYDDTTRTFITNDPGTRSGAKFRYGYDDLMDAMVNYPTGDNKPLFKKDNAMIIFKKA